MFTLFAIFCLQYSDRVEGLQLTEQPFWRLGACQRLIGTRSRNRLRGTARNDRLAGRQGDDLLQGKQGPDVLLGGAGADQIFGGLGDDTLIGGSSKDTLIGGAGNDTFKFQRPSDGSDKILDFQSGRDRIVIQQAGFKTRLGGGRLRQSRFRWGRQASSAKDRFLYDRSSGQLYFDADGSGRNNKIKLASFGRGTALVATDIVLSTPPANSRSVLASQGRFDITVKYLDNNLSATQQKLFNQAVNRWESIIVGDLPTVRLENGIVIDELMSGFLDVGRSPLSRITIAAFMDLGYQGNLNGADSYR